MTTKYQQKDLMILSRLYAVRFHTNQEKAVAIVKRLYEHSYGKRILPEPSHVHSRPDKTKRDEETMRMGFHGQYWG